MFNNESPIEIYYRNHPKALVEEYLQYVKEEKERKYAEEKERYNNCIEWYKNLNGRYFIITFNRSSFIALYVDKWPSSEFNTSYTCYNISLDSYSICKTERKINRYWFKNPYEKPYSGQDVGECKEITKEEFDSIVDKCNIIENLVKSINLK